MLDKALYVGPRANLLEQVRRVVLEISPSAAFEVRDPMLGRPGAGFPWNAYDVVFLNQNLGLPWESGMGWLCAIMSEDPGVRVVLLADQAHSVVRDTAIDLGASACLPTDEGGMKSLADWMLLVRDSRGGAEEDTQPAAARAGGGRALNSALTESGSAIRIPGYKIERMLARGGQSAVYTAVQTADNTRIALKVLSLEDGADPEFLSRFMREYATLCELKHPHVIQILERGFSNEFAYIAMELCPLGDLKARLKPGGIDPVRALDYLGQIADGLSAAHDIGIVHRDIKPGNVLLREQDSLVLTDFGVASDNSRDTRITRDQAIVGTPLYVSPEQIEGREPDVRCDLYSLGAVLFQMLTGRPPFQADSRIALLGLHVSAPVPRLSGNLSKFQPLIDGLLAKDPDERFQSTEELQQGLEWIRKAA